MYDAAQTTAHVVQYKNSNSGTILPGHFQAEIYKTYVAYHWEACRDPDILNQLASFLVEPLTPDEEDMS